MYLPRAVLVVVMAMALTSALTSEEPDNCPRVAADRRCSCWSSDITCEDLMVNDLAFLLPLPADYDRLYVNHNNLGRVSAGSLQGLANVTWLTLQHDRIAHVDPQALAPLQALEYLDLSYNELQQFLLQGIQLAHLHTLDLSHNALLRLKLDSSLGSLVSVILEGNRLKIPEDTFQFPNVIERVKISGNDIGNDLGFLKNLPNLATLWLAENNVSAVTEETFKINQKIQFLRLDSNNISNLNFLKNLPLLRGMNLTSNRLESIPVNTFENMSQLEHLYMENNKLSDISFIGHINNNLATLLLSNNGITGINSSTIRGKNRLKWLSLSDNNLQDLLFISELPNIETLFVDNNNLHSISQYQFNKTKINMLDISNNSIENTDFVLHTRYLKKLYISNNKLSQINSKTLENSIIDEADFSANGLQSMEFVRSLLQIKELTIANNNITSISEDIFINNSALEKLNISGNPITNMKFVFYTSRMQSLLASDCSIQSIDNVPLKCSRSVQVVTTNTNTTLSFIKSTTELWEECYGRISAPEISPMTQWTVLITITVLALSCLLILLGIILLETVIRCRRKRFYSYLKISDDTKKVEC